MKTIFFTVLLSFLLLTMAAKADVLGPISYQGTLTDEQGVAMDATLSLTFSIYTDSTEGDVLWTEEHPSVTVQQGIFNVLLGAINAIDESIFDGSPRWFGIQVGQGPELAPRKRILTVGYAFCAPTNDMAQRASCSPDSVETDWIILSDEIHHQAGRVGIGTMAFNGSAILQLESSDRGLTAPRLSDSEQLALADLASGLLIFSTAASRFNYFASEEWYELHGTPATTPPNTCDDEDDYEGNNTFAEAYSLAPITDCDADEFTISPTVCPFDDEDWFKVHIDDEVLCLTNPTVKLVIPAGQTYTVTAAYYCDSGGGISETETFSDSVSITLDISGECEGPDDSGTLYIQIIPVSANTDDTYKLTIRG